MTARHAAQRVPTWLLVLLPMGLAALWLMAPASRAEAPVGATFWLATLVLGRAGRGGHPASGRLEGRQLYATLTAALFGVWVVYFWQLLTVALEVPRVLLPAPWLIVQSLVDELPRLGNDFLQTVVKAVLIGWTLGSGLGFLVAIAIDRLPFLQRGLLPIASLTSTDPAGRRRADRGDVVRFRLAVQGRRGRADDLLPDAGVHAGRPAGLQPARARADAQLCRQLRPHVMVAAAAGGRCRS
jgi:hypothetical protein